MRSPDEAARIAIAAVGETWPYVLGGGNHKGPTRVQRKDGTYTPIGYDCWGFAYSRCYDEPRTVEGFNRGNPNATVTDAINCDSAIEEAEHFGQRFRVVAGPARIGNLLVMPSIRAGELERRGKRTGTRVRIGHVWIVVGVPAEQPARAYADYDTVQCQASRKPAIKRGPGPTHDARLWSGIMRDEWGIRVLEVVPTRAVEAQ